MTELAVMQVSSVVIVESLFQTINLQEIFFLAIRFEVVQLTLSFLLATLNYKPFTTLRMLFVEHYMYSG